MGARLSQKPPFSQMAPQIISHPQSYLWLYLLWLPRRRPHCEERRELPGFGPVAMAALQSTAPQPGQRHLRGRGFQRGRNGAWQRGLREKCEGEKCEEQLCKP